jgi:hypothetical protein
MNKNQQQQGEAYEAGLTAQEREQLHGWLSEPGLSLEAARKLAPPRRGGKRDGKPPSKLELAGIGWRARIARVLAMVRAGSVLSRPEVEAALGEYKMAKDIQEEFLEEVMMAIAQEVIQMTVRGEDAPARTAAARLLLEQAELKLKRAKFEQESAKAEAEEKARKKREKENARPGGTPDGSVPKEVFDRFAEELKLL